MTEPEYKKYIVICVDQCNKGERTQKWLIESKTKPTLESINGILYNNCLDISAWHNDESTCTNCGDAKVASFTVEPFTPERAKELGLIDIPYDSNRRCSQDNYLHRII